MGLPSSTVQISSHTCATPTPKAPLGDPGNMHRCRNHARVKATAEECRIRLRGKPHIRRTLGASSTNFSLCETAAQPGFEWVRYSGRFVRGTLALVLSLQTQSLHERFGSRASAARPSPYLLQDRRMTGPESKRRVLLGAGYFPQNYQTTCRRNTIYEYIEKLHAFIIRVCNSTHANEAGKGRSCQSPAVHTSQQPRVRRSASPSTD